MKRYLVLLFVSIALLFGKTASAQTIPTMIDGYQCNLPFYAGYVLSDSWVFSTVDKQVGLIALGYDLGPTGADGIWGPMSEAAAQSLRETHPDGKLSNVQTCTVARAIVRYEVSVLDGWIRVYNSLPPNIQNTFLAKVSRPVPAAYPSEDGYVAPGNGYGDISTRTGLPKTNYVRGYTRSNGVVVRSYYRSHR